MSLIRPFRGLRPAPGHAKDVAAPPYDVLNTAEAREMAANKPWSFLHISRPEIDLPTETDPYDDSVYTQGKTAFEAMLQKGILCRDPKPCYYIYRLVMGGHSQTGLVAVASVADYDSNRIRKHEFTRPVKEDDRVRQIDTLNAQTGPVFLTYRHQRRMDEIAEQVSSAPAAMDVTADDGVRHSVWVVDDAALVDEITVIFDAMDCLYIADGHHRSAAASRVAAARRRPDQPTPLPAFEYFLTVIFPDNQMRILDYNRVICDLNGLSAQQLLQAIQENFDVDKQESAFRPAVAHEFGMYLDGQWYRLKIKSRLIPQDPVKRLDVSLLADHLIAPLFAITDPRTDKRIDFVGGIRGVEALQQRVDSGEMAVAFSLYPTSLKDLMAVADANEVMPPKSTWFEPKLADGLISHVLDDE